MDGAIDFRVNTPQNCVFFFWPTQSHTQVRVQSHFKNEGNSNVHRNGGGQTCYFFMVAKKIVKCRKKNRAYGPKIRGVQKSKKRSFFGIQNVKISNPASKNFFSKNFQPTNAAEKALCTKRHFSNENHSKLKNAKNPKISKFLLSYF